MRNLKKIFCLMLALTFVFTFISPAATADAATKSIKEGKWVNITSKSTYYKIVVPGEGYITLSAKNTKGGVAYFDILDSNKEPFCDTETLFASGKKPQSIKVPVSKGKYYIRLNEDDYWDLGGYAYAKNKFTSVKQPENYCMGKALTLKAGSYKKIYQTPKYSFDRYFKIKLTKAKKITIKSKSEVLIYDDEGNWIDTTSSDTGGIWTNKTKKLKAGSYYIRVLYSDGDMPSINQVKWQ